MKRIKLSQILILAVLVAGPVRAQTKTVIEIPVRPTMSVNGADLFAQHCAVCHGKEGRGDGPAAAAMKRAPTDLTRIARNPGGKFPDLAVQQAIANSDSNAAHGAPRMPVWGELLESLPGDTSMAALRVHNLMRYIEGLQK
jgi:mono/diheme cytochrome c family protein